MQAGHFLGLVYTWCPQTLRLEPHGDDALPPAPLMQHTHPGAAELRTEKH